MGRDDEGGWLQKLDAKINARFPHVRWIVGGYLVLQFIWRAFNGAGDMIDAYSHAQFLAQHREAAIAAIKSGIAALFSPKGSLITMVLGGAYLVLDNRLARSALRPIRQERPERLEFAGISVALDGTPPPNIISARAETEWIPDPLDDDPDSHAQALIASFHNEPLAHAFVGIAKNVTASITYECGKGWNYEFARVIKAVWLTDQGSLANHVDFEVNSVRRLILAIQHPRIEFLALENLSDDTTEDARKVVAAIHRVPLEIPAEGPRCRAHVQFRINGQVCAQKFGFVLELIQEPTCCREEDEIPF